MAIAIEAFTVVVRNEAIVNRYPGGAEAFMMNVPNQTFCADHSLARVSFMVDDDANAFAEELESLGMRVSDGHDAVICDAFDQKVTPHCPWLCMGTYKDATIAWITGEQVKTIVGPRDWDPEKAALSHASKEEAAKRLKFLRDDGGVQVFWDSVLEKEVYVGRTQAPVDSLFQQAGLIVTANLRNPGEPVDKTVSIELQRAIEMLETVLDRADENWRVLWLLAKAWHALGKSDKACEVLTRAYTIQKEETVIPRELCGILLELGRSADAVRVAEEALGLDPLSPELLGNLAVAYLINSQLTASDKTMRAALKQEPQNEINQALHVRIQEIVAGTRKQPKNLFELSGAMEG